MPFTIRYEFDQHFDFPAKDAYKWATDYEPEDSFFLGLTQKRKVEWIDKRTVILTEFFRKDEKRFTKKKLVRLNPERFSWTNTHISGPTKYSQFLYEIIPEGKKTSRLHFTGLQLEYGNVSPKGLAAKIKKEDSEIWKRLAKAMEKDLGKRLLR